MIYSINQPEVATIVQINPYIMIQMMKKNLVLKIAETKNWNELIL